jgi:hypothetical protein
MSKFRVSSNKSSQLYYPNVKPTLNLDLVNADGLDPRYTFTRNSSATYVDANGIIRTAAPNQPRFEFDALSGECKGLLVEEARTNLLVGSETFSGLYFTGVGAGDIKTVLYGTAPNGLANQTVRFQLGAAARALRWVSGDCGIDAISTQYCFSFYYRGSLPINISGRIGAGVEVTVLFPPSGTSMGRAYAVFTSGTHATAFVDLTYFGNSDSELWGLQVEKNASFPTSYIPTTTSTVTRQPDQLVLNNAPLSSQGTFYLEARPTTGTGLVADNGSSTLALTPTLNQTTKNALFYNTSRTLSMSSSITPVEINGNVPQNLNRVSLGFDGFYNSSYINGHIKNFKYYSSPVTEDNLRSLTGNTRPTFRFVEQIITNGLVLYLDAGNPVSYPGSGTTWTDLSGNGNNGTLVNGVGYNSGNGGSLVFDGVDDVVTGNITGSIFTGSFTQSAWVYKLTVNKIWQGVFTNSSPATSNTYLMTFGNGTVAAPFNSVGVNRVGESESGVFLDIGTHTNRWLYIVMTKTGSTLNIYCYKDGSLLQNSGTITWNNGNFATTNNYQIGRHWAGPSIVPLQGNISQVSIYNRALTAQEIQQNFNELRLRFGI